jgi:hypothetical protein
MGSLTLIRLALNFSSMFANRCLVETEGVNKNPVKSNLQFDWIFGLVQCSSADVVAVAEFRQPSIALKLNITTNVENMFFATPDILK